MYSQGVQYIHGSLQPTYELFLLYYMAVPLGNGNQDGWRVSTYRPPTKVVEDLLKVKVEI